MQYYQIENWDDNFETPESKKIKNLKWVAIQNSFDGKIYKRLLKHPEPARVFGIAVLMAELASRAPKEYRGKIVGSDLSTGYSIEDMADKTGMPVDDFLFAIPILKAIGWISFYDDSRKLSGSPDKNPLHNITGHNRTTKVNQPAGCPSVEKPVDKAFDKLSDAGLIFFEKLSDTEKAMAKGLGYKFINAAKVTDDTKIKIVRGLILLYSKWPDAPKFSAMHIHRDASSLYVLGAINACNARASPPEKWPEYFQACIHKHGAAISDREWLQQQQDIKAGFKKIKLSDILPSAGESNAKDQ